MYHRNVFFSRRTVHHFVVVLKSDLTEGDEKQNKTKNRILEGKKPKLRKSEFKKCPVTVIGQPVVRRFRRELALPTFFSLNLNFVLSVRLFLFIHLPNSFNISIHLWYFTFVLIYANLKILKLMQNDILTLDAFFLQLWIIMLICVFAFGSSSNLYLLITQRVRGR